VNVVFISIDSLSRHWLKRYGQRVEFEIDTPNLERFAHKATTFDTHYAGSLPCMPARREFFSGIQEFVWRPWGPMEPFDMPLSRAARRAGAVSQLVTDHYHYFQHGSHGYFEDFNGFDFVRGHESDAWSTKPRNPDQNLLKQLRAEDSEDITAYMSRAAYARNVASFDINDETNFFPAKVFSRTADWIRESQDYEKWFLAVDSFDVHEPFHCPEPYASMYTDENPRDPDLVVWPVYGPTDQGRSKLTQRQIDFVRAQFAGKITMVDRWFGEVLDTLDRLDHWNDTMVIVTTDHGHYLGEHGWIGKPNAPFYNVLAHTPLIICHPENPKQGVRTSALTSAVYLYATMVDALEGTVPSEVHSQSLMPVLRGERERHRDWAIYGYWGSTMNVTDGRYTYFQPCDSSLPAYAHSTMMIQMDPWDWFQPPKPHFDAEAGKFLPYTDSPVWRYASDSMVRHEQPMLFDVQEDPGQENDLINEQPTIASDMKALLVSALTELDAPEQQFKRLKLDKS
jgi:arylsulfatase A-like enzyme